MASRHNHLSQKDFIVSCLSDTLITWGRMRFIDDFGKESQPFFSNVIRGLVMESSVMSLEDYLENNAPSVCKRICILEELNKAVGYIHSCGVVHCNLKLENIELFTDARWKLVNFEDSHENGAIVKIRTQFTSHQSDAGAYIDLQQLFNFPEGVALLLAPALPATFDITWSMDIWSLGMIAFHLLATPHSSPFQQIYDVLELPHHPQEGSLRNRDLQWLDEKINDFVNKRCQNGKIKSFLQACLKANRNVRWHPYNLIKHELYSIDASSQDLINGWRRSLEDLEHTRSQSISPEHLDQQTRSIITFLRGYLPN